MPCIFWYIRPWFGMIGMALGMVLAVVVGVLVLAFCRIWGIYTVLWVDAIYV